MRASELIAKLQELTNDGDREVEFVSYEIGDNPEHESNQKRYLSEVKKCRGKVRIYLSV